MQRGVISRLEPDQGYGYLVRPTFGSSEIAFRASALDGLTLEQLQIGQPVEFELAADMRRGPRAEQVRVIED
jgi:cold shock CspA family protein